MSNGIKIITLFGVVFSSILFSVQINQPQTDVIYQLITRKKEITPEYEFQSPIFILNNSAFKKYGFPGTGTSNAPYCINNFHIENSNTSIVVKNTNLHFKIFDNKIIGKRELSKEKEPYGIYLQNVSHGIIEGNILTNFDKVGLYISHSSHIEVMNNLIRDSSSLIDIYDGNFLKIYNNTLETSTVGLDASFLFSSEINNNSMVNCDQSLKLVIASSVTIKHNHIQFYSAGIKLHEVSLVNISHNTINNGTNGLYMVDTNEDITIQFNVISNSLKGAQLEGKRVIVANNVIYDNKYGLVSEKLDNSKLYENELFANEYGIYFKNTGNIATNNTISLNHIHLSSYYGLYLEETFKTSIKWNIFDFNQQKNTSAYSQAYDNGFDNEFSFNFWSDQIKMDRNNDLIVDFRYLIAFQTISHINYDKAPLLNRSLVGKQTIRTPMLLEFSIHLNPPKSLELNWSAALDSYQTVVTYDVFYSEDNENWETIAVGLSATFYRYNSSYLFSKDLDTIFFIKILTKSETGMAVESFSFMIVVDNFISEESFQENQSTRVRKTSSINYLMIIWAVISLIFFRKRAL